MCVQRGVRRSAFTAKNRPLRVARERVEQNAGVCAEAWKMLQSADVLARPTRMRRALAERGKHSMVSDVEQLPESSF